MMFPSCLLMVSTVTRNYIQHPSSLYKDTVVRGDESEPKLGGLRSNPLPSLWQYCYCVMPQSYRRSDVQGRTKHLWKFTLVASRKSINTYPWDAEMVHLPTRILHGCIKPITVTKGWQLILCTNVHWSRLQALHFHIPEYMWLVPTWQNVNEFIVLWICHTHYVRKQRQGLFSASSLKSTGTKSETPGIEQHC